MPTFSWMDQGKDRTDLSAGVRETIGETTLDISFQTSIADNDALTQDDRLFDNDASDDASSLYLFGNSDGEKTWEVTIDFSSATDTGTGEVENVSFSLHDIDSKDPKFTDVVTLSAFDASGNSIPVTITPQTENTMVVSTTADGFAVVTSTFPASIVQPFKIEGSANVTIDGPVAKIILQYSNSSEDLGTQRINVGDIDFNEMPFVPSPPVADADVVSMDQNTFVNIDVLQGDTDADGNELTVVATSDPTQGKTQINPNGTVTYTPNEGFNGTDTFTYTISDGTGLRDTATVEVTVIEPFVPPTANDDAYTVEDDTGIRLDVLANDTDEDGDDLTLTAVSTPENGMASLTPDGAIAYLPNVGFTGTDTFTYTISDGRGGTDTATVTMSVTGTQPFLDLQDDEVSTVDTPVLLLPLQNDSISGGGTLTIIGTTDPNSGSVQINDDNSVLYTPDEHFSGMDQFDYTVSDGNGLTDTATITVLVAGIPSYVIASPDKASTFADAPVIIPVLDDDESDHNLPLTVIATYGAENGNATINPDNTISYTPSAGFVGTDTFEYEVSDGQGGTDSAGVTVTIENDPGDLILQDDEVSTIEDTPVVLLPLQNDSINGDGTLTIIGTTDPNFGSVQINDDNSVLYTPDEHFSGMDQFDYTVSDGNGLTDTATITVTVDGIENDIAASDDTADTFAGEPVVIPVLEDDFDSKGYPLTVVALTDPWNGYAEIADDGQVIYTPDESFSGVDTFDYFISDGKGAQDSATVTVTVSPSEPKLLTTDDTATVQEGETIVVDVLNGDSSSTGQPLTVVDVTAASNGLATLAPDGTVSYTANEDYVGEDTFTYTISDGLGEIATANANITVFELITIDPIALDDFATVSADATVMIDVLNNDTDPLSDDQTVILVTDPSDGSVTLNDDGTLEYDPNDDFVGEDTFDYTISDGTGRTDSATVTVTVTEPIVPVVLANDTVTTPEDSGIIIDVLANDISPDSIDLTVISTSDPVNGTTFINDDNTITYVPELDFNGPDTFTYTVSDGRGATFTAEAFVDVTPINDAPRVDLDPAPVFIEEDTSFDFNPLSSALDVDGDPLTVTAITAATYGSAVLNADGTITFTPDPDVNSDGLADGETASVSYSVSDGNGGVSIGYLPIEITPVDDEPDATPDIATAVEDSPIEIDVLGNDTDVEDADLTIIDVAQPANGSVEITDDNTLIYTPDPDFAGEDQFAYTVSDGAGGIDTADVTLAVTGTPDTPVALADTADVAFETPTILDVAGNDVDRDGDTIEILSVTTASNGIVQLNEDGTVTYTPNAGFEGEDMFRYRISDGNGGFDTEFVTVTVAPAPNVAPTANDDTLDLVSGETALIDPTTNDTDGNGDTLEIIPTSLTEPANGTITLTDDGRISYTPDEDFVGNDTFTYAVTDGQGGTNSASVTVTVSPVEGSDTTTFGTNGADTIIADAAENTIFGLNGNDTIDGGDSADIIDAGDGDDTIIAGSGDSVFGGQGDDRLTIETAQEGEGAITFDAGEDTDGDDTDTLNLRGILGEDGKQLIMDDILFAKDTDQEDGSVTLKDGTVLNFTNVEEILVCFAHGTMIRTPNGDRAIEDLAKGDLITTKDHGAQELRWIGSRTVEATGKFAPIKIAKGAMGNDADLRVSPLHRMLVDGWKAEMLYGETEVLVAAKHLVNDETITAQEGGEVTYFHMLFDTHQIVFANGAPSESFHPGDAGLRAVSAAARDEIFALFPELQTNPLAYGSAARMSLKEHEAGLL